MAEFTYEIVTTRYSVLADGTPNNIVNIYWKVTAVEGAETLSKYGTLNTSLDFASTTEQDCIDAVQAANPNIESDMLTEIEANVSPSIISGLPWKDMQKIWKSGVSYIVGDIRRYGSTIYEALQSHTSQAGWTPPNTPALWKIADDPTVIETWVQPTGAHDAYNIGDEVTHDNPNDSGNIWVYRSKIDGNTTEPGRDGTFDRWWEPISLA